MVVIHRKYEFLIADPERNSEYIRGSDVGGYRVFGSADEMLNEFHDMFCTPKMQLNRNGMQLPIMHVDGTTVVFGSETDREIEGHPKCYGRLNIIGDIGNVNSVHDKLVKRFPDIDAIVDESEYSA